MSDTDDTDALLLIPPDFFLVPSDSEIEESYSDLHCNSHCTVVNTLVNQVTKLENRINKIEVSSDVQYLDSLSDNTSTIIPLSEMSEDNKMHDSTNTDHTNSSTFSTPHKNKFRSSASSPMSPYKCKRPSHYSKLPKRVIPGGNLQSNITSPMNNSTNIDERSFRSSPKCINKKKILGEIDHFLKNVETIKSVSNQMVSTPNIKIESVDAPSEIDDTCQSELNTLAESKRRFNNLNLKDVNRLIEAIESQQEAIDENDKQLDELYEKKISTKNITNSWLCGETRDTVPNLDFGMRATMYRRENPKSTQNEQTKRSSDNRSESEVTEPTVREKLPSRLNISNFTEVEMASTLIANYSDPSLGNVSDFNQQQINNNPLLNTSNNNNMSNNSPCMTNKTLFSLADIWTKQSQQELTNNSDKQNLLPKLEEEMCRRKHCEKVICDLQSKILEMQQRLAVAVQVDSAKDEAILRFHESWERVANQWTSLEAEKNTLATQLKECKEQASNQAAEAKAKIDKLERQYTEAVTEMFKSEEKSSNFELAKDMLTCDLETMEKNMMEYEEEIKKLRKEKNSLLKTIENMELTAQKNKELVEKNQEELTENNNLMSAYQKEMDLMKNEYEKLKNKIDRQQTLIYELESQKNNLHVMLEAQQKNEGNLQSEITRLRREFEGNKTSLREYYQKQVDNVVHDKLKEFQGQLEEAEQTLDKKYAKKERDFKREFVRKFRDETREEIALIETKHRDEIQLYETKLEQLKEHNTNLQNKLDHYHTKQSSIVQELHNVMEAQWLEALRIINHGRSPIVDSSHSSHELRHKDARMTDPNEPGPSSVRETRQSYRHDKSREHLQQVLSKNDKYPSTSKSLPAFDASETPVSSRVQSRDQEIQKIIDLVSVFLQSQYQSSLS